VVVLVDYLLVITVLPLDHLIQLLLVLAALEAEQVFRLTLLQQVIIQFLEILLHLVVAWAAIILEVTAVLEVVVALRQPTLLFLVVLELLDKEMLAALVMSIQEHPVAMEVAVAAQER
jgi:hypothetical protein